MKQTFQNASATYSWLGPARDDSVWRFDLLRTSPANGQKILRFHCSIGTWRTSLSDVGGYREHSSSSPKWPYFTRLWILQEFVLAAKVVLFCGNQWMKLPVLMRWLDSIDANDRPWGNIPRNVMKKLSQSMLHRMCKMRKTQFLTSDFEELF
jgi:hypothetical protein